MPEPPTEPKYWYDYPAIDDLDPDMPLTDVEQYLQGIAECGRKKNAKTEEFRVVFERYNLDAYYLFSRLFTDRFPRPDSALGVGTDTLLEAAGEVLWDDYADANRARAKHGDSLAQAAREEIGYGDSGYSLTFHQLWMKLTEVAARETPKATIVDVLEDTAYPSVWFQMLGDGPTLYVYTENILNGAKGDMYGDIPKQADLLDDAPLAVYNYWHDDRLDVLSPEPHVPIGEMKAKSEYDASNVDELNKEQWVAQTKYDGARIYVHDEISMGGGKGPRVYLAGGRDVTPVLPELFEDPLHDELPYGSYILDGEAVPYDAETGEVLDFQHVLKRTGREDTTRGIEDDVEIKFKFFDVLYYEGNDLTNEPYEKRLGILKEHFLPPRIAQTGENLEATFARSIDDGHEGVVLKTKDHKYDFNNRSDRWQKWKAEPMEADFRVTDLHEGSGEMTGTMGSLELALEGPSGGNVPVGRVGTGFTDADRHNIWEMYHDGEMTIETVQVSFEELQYSEEEGWSLRFPSFDAIRHEGEVDTLERVACEIADKGEEFEVWKGGY